MSRIFVHTSALVIFASVASGALSQPAQYSQKDIVDAFTKPAPIDGEAQGSRGFSLPTRTNLNGGAPPHGRGGAHVASRVSVSRAAVQPTLHRDLMITFKTGSAQLTQQAKANAQIFAEAINSPALAAARFDIDGYTDAQGDPSRNQLLSQARAASLKDFLVAQGVGDERLTARGFGASDYAVPADPMSAKNRRVEARRID